MKPHSIIHKAYWAILHMSRNNRLLRPVIDIAAYAYYVVFRSHKTFTFNNHTYSYFYHLYNRTFSGERQVEISIARRYLEQYSGKRILEVGNVLQHYMPISHDVLDKYEKGKGVMNKDVATFSLKKRYDLIISVSTMEHVGHSYGEHYDPKKFLVSVANLKRHLNKNGILVITVPVFFNPALTKLIVSRRMPFTRDYFMKRISYANDWVQVPYAEAVKGSVYDGHFANTNILYIGIFKKS